MSGIARVDQQPSASQSARPVVLVVDDDADTVEELSDLVRSMGYPVRKARDPGLALNMVAESPDIGVVLLDLRMPRLDGLSLATRLARGGAGASPLFIFMSGRATIDDTIAAVRLDAVDFLVKPVAQKALARALARANDLIAGKRRDLLRNVEIMRSVEAVASHAIKLANELSSIAPVAARQETAGPVFTPRAARARVMANQPGYPQPEGGVAAAAHASADASARNEFLRNRITALIAARRARTNYFDASLFSDPCWDMLLDLMNERLAGKEVAVSSLCIAAGVPQTTGLRRIDDLIRAGLLVRREDPRDRRRVFVDLADTAVERLNRYMDEMNILG
ncbi:MAG: response regulator [Alphaproteobacteria bacterium]|nr:response regulator [Alphaproteobacteria bacterium]